MNAQSDKPAEISVGELEAMEERIAELEDVAEAGMKVRFNNKELTEALRAANYLKGSEND